MDNIEGVDCLSSASPMISTSALEFEQYNEEPELPRSIEINSVVINGGENHIGDQHLNITKTDNLILKVASLEQNSDSAEAQIIKSIQTNLEDELNGMRACDKQMSFLTRAVVLASVLTVLVVTVFATSIVHQPGSMTTDDLYISDNASYCDGICFVTKEEWGTKWTPSEGADFCVRLNATTVVTDLSSFRVCVNIKQCTKVLRGPQDRLGYNNLTPVEHISFKNNFVIGGDERYYEGRGWYCGWEDVLSTTIIFNNYTLAISERQTYLFQLLIHVGRKCGFINREFKFIFKCGAYCYTYKDFELIVNMNKQDMFLVRDYETFIQDSKMLSNNDCENLNYICRVKVPSPSPLVIVQCNFV